MDAGLKISEEYPVLLDQYLENAIEVDVDAVADGQDVYVAGVMQHVEEAGIHSGDSACSLPPHTLSAAQVNGAGAAGEPSWRWRCGWSA